MKKSGKFSVMAAGALALTSLFGMSTFADSRHPDESSWRESHRGDDRYDDRDRRRRDRRRDDRDFLSGYVARVDLRRGDYVTFVGDWSRGGVFEAWRIADVDSGRTHERGW